MFLNANQPAGEYGDVASAEGQTNKISEVDRYA
jgi:hypothetical protein